MTVHAQTKESVVVTWVVSSVNTTQHREGGREGVEAATNMISIMYPCIHVCRSHRWIVDRVWLYVAKWRCECSVFFLSSSLMSHVFVACTVLVPMGLLEMTTGVSRSRVCTPPRARTTILISGLLSLSSPLSRLAQHWKRKHSNYLEHIPSTAPPLRPIRKAECPNRMRLVLSRV